MPARSPPLSSRLKQTLGDLGQRLRARRKRLGVTATATAEAAGMSRVTLHRIERGEPSVAIGAYLGVVHALGLSLELANPDAVRAAAKPPGKIRLGDYPELKRLAWQIAPKRELTPRMALAVYERNWRHLDPRRLSAEERELIETLFAAFGKESPIV